MLEDILAVFESPDYYEEGELTISRAESNQDVFEIQLSLWLSDRTQQIWDIHCHKPREYQILFERTEYLWIEQEHPLLIPYK